MIEDTFSLLGVWGEGAEFLSMNGRSVGGERRVSGLGVSSHENQFLETVNSLGYHLMTSGKGSQAHRVPQVLSL